MYIYSVYIYIIIYIILICIYYIHIVYYTLSTAKAPGQQGQHNQLAPQPRTGTPAAAAPLCVISSQTSSRFSIPRSL